MQTVSGDLGQVLSLNDVGKLPALVSGVKYTLIVQLENIHPTVLSDQVQVMIVDAQSTTPLVATGLQMPATQQIFAAGQ